MNLSFEVNGTELLNKRFNRTDKAIGSFKPYMPEVSDAFDGIQQDWFSSQGRGSWQPLSAGYAAWKAVNFPGQPLLVLTGALSEAPFKPQLVGESSFIIKAEAPFYWSYHQNGTSRMPARPPYIVDAGVKRKLTESLKKAIFKQMRNGR